MRELNRLLETLLYPIYAPIYALLMLYFTGNPYALFPAKGRLFILGTVVLYTILIPKPLIKILEVRFHVRMNRWRTHAIYILSQLLCYSTLKDVMGVEPLLQVMAAAIICEVLLPLLGHYKNSSAMTMGMMLSFIALINFVGRYRGDLFIMLIVAIFITGYICTVEFGHNYTKRRYVLSSLLLGGCSYAVALFL